MAGPREVMRTKAMAIKIIGIDTSSISSASSDSAKILICLE